MALVRFLRYLWDLDDNFGYFLKQSPNVNQYFSLQYIKRKKIHYRVCNSIVVIQNTLQIDVRKIHLVCKKQYLITQIQKKAHHFD